MAEEETHASMGGLFSRFTGPTFRRIGRWGLAAIAAVSVAYLVGSSDLGLRRMATAFSNVQGLPTAAAVQPRDDGEIVRLSETLRRLTGDRDRLLTRLDMLERNLDDLTGSISLKPVPPRASENTPPTPPEPTFTQPTIPSIAPLASKPPNAAAVPVQPPMVVAPANESVQDDTPTPPATAKVDFGIDLGSAQTVEGLRSLWTAAKGKHAKLLDGLRPIVVLRENARPGGVELRLVAGPLASAALAARLCVVIITAGTVCQPAVFDGQRLAMR